jgi:hypothetical protein
MTPQEIFEKVLEGISSQGYKKSESITGRCMYRGPNGLKCAAGHLIPDEMYNPMMESKGIIYLINEFKMPNYFCSNSELIYKLQVWHDFYLDCISNAYDRLKEISEQYNVEIPEKYKKELEAML